MANGNGSNKLLASVVAKFVFGLGAGIVADAFIDITNFPILNESGLFGNSASNFETLSLAVVAGGISAGLVDLFSSKSVLGFSKDLLPFLAGYGVGIQQWNSWIAQQFGFRQFNLYDTVGGFIPQIY